MGGYLPVVALLARDRARPTGGLKIVLLEFITQCIAADAQNPRRLGLIPARCFERADIQKALLLRQRAADVGGWRRASSSDLVLSGRRTACQEGRS